jgi:hypothetical protein
MTSRDWASFPLNIGEDTEGSRKSGPGGRKAETQHSGTCPSDVLPSGSSGGSLQRRCTNSCR